MATHTAPILERILEFRRAAIEELRQRDATDAISSTIVKAPSVRDFRGAITSSGVALIAECKERSPSGGLLQATYDPIALARRYAANGAAAISVLTEPEFFGGSFLHLKEVRASIDRPVLCKDFVIDPIQVMAARAAGADAVLLIVAILDDAQLKRLREVIAGLGMVAVVEVHDPVELERALDAGARIIGINNRDLTRMTTDKGTTALLKPLIPKDCAVISESGIQDREDIEELARLEVDAALVGEALLRAADLDAKVRELSGR
jgi:indole-3-glycerol phosphate synthase